MSIYWYPGQYFEYNIAICSRASNLRITLQLISHYALSWIIFLGKYIHSANLKHSENKTSRAQFLLADFETDNYFYSLFLVFANFGCFTISFTSQVVLKHLNEFGASIIVDFKRRINWKSGMSKTAASVAVVEASNSVAVSKKYTKRRGEC